MSVAKQVFDSLQGRWNMRRQLKSAVSGYPVGIFQGVANFTPREPSASAFDAEYVYTEEGELQTETGLKFKASRKYAYRYECSTDQISTWFIKDDGMTVDYLFNELRLEQSSKSEVNGIHVLKGDHLCVSDMYHASYQFRSPGENMTFSVIYHVQGPKKDYSHDTAYSRS
jgi:hypothetical protein